MRTYRFTHLFLSVSFFFAIAVLTVSCGGDDAEETIQPQTNSNRNRTDEYREAGRLEFPKLKSGTNIVLIHKTDDGYDPDGVNFAVEWDYEKKSARWTCYQITKRSTEQHTSRYYGNPQYPEDPDLPSAYCWDADYFYGSGFDHGHICPSADRLYSAEANYQTFFLTNMQPQYGLFNGSVKINGVYKGLWSSMENRVRKWAPRNTTDTLYVVKGGTIDRVFLETGADDGVLMRIKGKLIVPKYFFTALLYKNKSGYRALAFWFPHLNENHADDDLADYAISIDELEARTGIDFFCNLPDDAETQTERSLPLSAWGL